MQSAVMARRQLAAGDWGISLGTGASIGAYKKCDGCPFENGDVRSWDRAKWSVDLPYLGVVFRVPLMTRARSRQRSPPNARLWAPR